MNRSFKSIALVLCGVAVFCGCSLIDEDLRDCGPDTPPVPVKECEVDYQLSLVTNLTTEISTALDMTADIEVAGALKDYLGTVFTDRAHDVDLSFYDVEGQKARLHHESHVMDASQTSYTLSIPARRYMHLAIANLDGNPALHLEGDQLLGSSSLQQEVRDTVPAHTSGIFSARLAMDVREGEDQEFAVNLRMANCSAAVVLDTLGSKIKDVKVFARGFATGFMLADSTYRFDHKPIVRTRQLEVKNAHELCFATVAFPSPDGIVKAEDEEEILWEMRVYITLPDNTITENILGISEPLKAGELRILKGVVYPNGTLVPEDQDVAILVQPDWQPGEEHDIDL